MIGLTISHYGISATLGDGGTGDVNVAEDTNFKSEVAVKLPHHHFSVDDVCE